jgi:2-haloacid dehalogenase
MVAAHVHDLAAAWGRGLRTAYVHRPHESGPHGVAPVTNPAADLDVTSLTDLAARLARV